VDRDLQIEASEQNGPGGYVDVCACGSDLFLKLFLGALDYRT